MKNYLLMLVYTVSCAAPSIIVAEEKPFFTPRFRSVQIDYTTVFFDNVWSLSVDVDLKDLKSKQGKPDAIGLRAGIERLTFIRLFEGEVYGSPFRDYNLFARVTTDSPDFRLDTYAGFTYRVSSRDKPLLLPYVPADRGGLKFGADVKWMIIEKYFGMMLKFNVQPMTADLQLSGGVGVVLAWEK
jgi:hypothetical protein